MLTIIIFLLVTISTCHASLTFALCTKVNERPGICPSYSRTCMTPYPIRISHRKSFKCICDTDCRKYYKCCQDSCYSHGICKRVIFDTTTTTINPLGPFLSPIISRSATMKHMCQDEEQHPGLCPPYSIIHPTPLPRYVSWNKPYRCKCDSECKLNYKCCEDSYFEHGVCKPAIRIPNKKIPSDDEDLEYSGSGHNTNMNENYSGSGASSGDNSIERFSGSGYEPINIDNEILSTQISITIYNSDDDDFKFSGIDTIDQEIVVSGSGDFSGERFSGSGHEPIYIDDERLTTRIPITKYFNDDEDFEYSGFDETINQYSGSGDFSGSKEIGRYSGSGHEPIYTDDERLATRIPITIYFNDDEDFEYSGFDETINHYSGFGDFSSSKEIGRYSGSGHEPIYTDDERLATRIPITKYFNDDEDFEYSGFDETIIYGYSGSGDFSGDTESEQFSGSGYGPLDNDEFSGNEVKHYADGKFYVKEKFADNLNFKFENTEIIAKPAENNYNVIEPDDMYFAEPDNSDISHDTETQIYPTNKYTDKHKQNSEENLNKFANNIHTNKYKHGDDF